MAISSARRELLAAINEQLERCEEDRSTGELIIRILFNQGGMRQAMVQRPEEKLVICNKNLDNIEIFGLSEK